MYILISTKNTHENVHYTTICITTIFILTAMSVSKIVFIYNPLNSFRSQFLIALVFCLSKPILDDLTSTMSLIFSLKLYSL